MCEALKNAGIVLRVGDMVYLKPEEVVEIILRVGIPFLLAPTGALTEHFLPRDSALYAPARYCTYNLKELKDSNEGWLLMPLPGSFL